MKLKNDLITYVNFFCQLKIHFPDSLFDENEPADFFLRISLINRNNARFQLSSTCSSSDQHWFFFSRIDSTGVFILPGNSASFAFDLREENTEDSFPYLADRLKIDEDIALVCFLIVPLLCKLMDSGLEIPDNTVHE